MFTKALQLMIFWRCNHLPSIVFKAAVWGLISWLAVGMFATVREALLAAAAITLLSVVGYGVKKRQQSRKLMELCNGDLEKYAALQARLNTPEMAGAVLREMLQTELKLGETEDQDPAPEDNEREPEPLSQEDRLAIINANAHLIRNVATLSRQAALATESHCDEIEQAMLYTHDDGEEYLSIEEVVSEFLPDHVIRIALDNPVEVEKRDALVEEFAAKPGYTVTSLEGDDVISLICLPDGMYDNLNKGVTIDQAA